MRGIPPTQLGLTEEFDTPPWGDRSATTGAKWAPDAMLFREAHDIGWKGTGENVMKEVAACLPEWFKEDGELTLSDVVKRINDGGRHPDLGNKAFRLQRTPGGFYQVCTFLQVIAKYDLTNEVAKTADSKKASYDTLLQDAELEIKALPKGTRQDMRAAYLKYDQGLIHLCHQLQADISLAVGDLVGKPELRDSHQPEDAPKLMQKNNKK